MISPLEFIWFVGALVGLTLSARMLRTVLQDRQYLIESGINSTKMIIVTMNVRTYAIRSIVATGILVQSIAAMLLPSSTNDFWFHIHPGISFIAYAVMFTIVLSICFGAILDSKDRQRLIDEESKKE